jgi:hypothetical protein
VVAVAAWILVVGPAAHGLINPRFTPVHLVEQSRVVYRVRLAAVDAKSRSPVTVVKAVKGKTPETGLVLDLSEADKPQQELLVEFIKQHGAETGLFFQGEYREEGEGMGMGMGMGMEGGMEPVDEGTQLPSGLLHLHGKWFGFIEGKGGVWHLDAVNVQMQATWAGSTEMLLLATKYVLESEDPVVPSVSGATWEEIDKAGQVSGTAHGILAVDIKGDNSAYLHALSDGGDVVLAYNAKTMEFNDVTKALGIDAKSKKAAWVDLTGDGRLDLASWDGGTLSVYAQGADGTFAARGAGLALKECLGLAVVGVGQEGRAALVASTKELPLLITYVDGVLKARPAAAASGTWPGAALGEPHGCVVADFDNDAIPDIVQPFEKGLLFYKGTSPGAFASPATGSSGGTGKGHARPCAGDFDQDGLLDVFAAAELGCSLWNNLGKGTFEPAMQFAGEMAYISQPDAHDGMACDINNDGRQDVMITYTNMRPHVFFNRGFRSFGHAHMLDLKERRLLPEAEPGQRGGVVHDLDRDGAQDMALVLENGEVHVCWRSRAQGDPLCLRAVLPAAGPAGPVRVEAHVEKRSLGAWNVVPGTTEAFFGMVEPGPCTVTWQFPGAAPQEQRVFVQGKGGVRFVLTPTGGRTVAAGTKAPGPQTEPVKGTEPTPRPQTPAEETTEPAGAGLAWLIWVVAIAVGVLVMVLVVRAAGRKPSGQ